MGKAPLTTEKARLLHYKTQSRSILRLLSNASFLNGSHFAILWVNSAGHHELFSSDVFQPKLDKWFPQSTLAEACEVVLTSRAEKEATERMDQAVTGGASASSGNGSGGGQDDEETLRYSTYPSGLVGSAEDEEDIQGIDGDSSDVGQWERIQIHQQQQQQHTNSSISTRPRSSTLASTTTASTPGRPLSSSSSAGMITGSSSQSLVTPQHNLASSSTNNRIATRSSHLPTDPPSFSSPSLASVPAISLALVTFTPQSLAVWYTERFNSWQEKTCKTVLKVWIRVAEPKRQSLYPYSGDQGRPSWWPSSVRYREADHLLKPERITLLATILRTTGVAVEDFELATENSAAFIPQKGIQSLREVYKVARAERGYLQANNNAPFESLQVLLPIPPPDPNQEDEDDEDGFEGNPSTRSARHRAGRSITSFTSEQLELPPTRPRDSTRPYPASRTNSNADNSSASQPASSPFHPTPLARSASLSSSQNTIRDKPRSRRNRSSLTIDSDHPQRESDLTPPTAHSPYFSHHQTSTQTPSPSLQPAINLQAFEPPRNPDSRSSSANNSPRAPETSPSGAFVRPQEPSFASPAMIKSRSRLSQQPMLPIAETPLAPRARVYGQPHTSSPMAYSGDGQQPSPQSQQHQPAQGQAPPSHPHPPPSQQQQPQQQQLNRYPPSGPPSHQPSQPMYPIQIHAGHNVDSYPVYNNSEGYFSPPMHSHPSPLHQQQFYVQTAQYQPAVDPSQYHRGVDPRSRQHHTFDGSPNQHQQIDATQQFAMMGLGQPEMRQQQSQDLWDYYPSDSAADAQAIAYIQQLPDYELERQQSAYIARQMQSQSNMGMEYEMEQRKEEDRRRYNEHVFGQAQVSR